jgi:hypothetical protein
MIVGDKEKVTAIYQNKEIMTTAGEIEAICDYVDEQRILALGWATADACAHLDKGIDYREVEVPTILERFQKDLG